MSRAIISATLSPFFSAMTRRATANPCAILLGKSVPEKFSHDELTYIMSNIKFINIHDISGNRNQRKNRAIKDSFIGLWGGRTAIK